MTSPEAPAVHDDRAEELLSTARQLWPAPATVSLARARTPVPPGQVVARDLLVVPSAARPRLLVPAGFPKAAAAAVRSYAHGSGLPHRLGRSLAAAVMVTPLAESLLPHRVRVCVPAADRHRSNSVEDHIRELLRPDALIGIRVGSPRANRKPVLPVMGRGGDLLAYVKVGHNPLTRTLVDQEGEALSAVASVRLSSIRAPRVLHRGFWHGFELLVMSPLDVPASRWGAPAQLPVHAMTELSTAFGVARSRLADSAFWSRTAQRVGGVTDEATAQRLRSVLASIAAKHSGRDLSFGAWHGDWAPWNMAWRRDAVLLWDWERFGQGVPLGFDALHYLVQAALAGNGFADAERVFVQDSRSVLRDVGVTDEAALTRLLYLVEISLRYVLDAQGPTGEPLRHIARWSLEFLTSQVAQA